MLGITKWKHCKGFLWEANYGVEIHLNASLTKKNFTNGIEPIYAPRIWKLVLNVKKLGGSDMDKSNPYAICNAIHLFIMITMWKTMLWNVEDNGKFLTIYCLCRRELLLSSLALYKHYPNDWMHEILYAIWLDIMIYNMAPKL